MCIDTAQACHPRDVLRLHNDAIKVRNQSTPYQHIVRDVPMFGSVGIGHAAEHDGSSTSRLVEHRFIAFIIVEMV